MTNNLRKRIFPDVPFGRKPRQPTYPVAGAWRPFGIYPVFAGPIMAGETFKGLRARMRAISMPLNYPLGGAYLHFFAVYCSVRAAMGTTDVINQVSPDLTGLTATATNNRLFTKLGQFDLLPRAYERAMTDCFARNGQTLPSFDGVRKMPRLWRDWLSQLNHSGGINLVNMPETWLTQVNKPSDGLPLDDELRLSEGGEAYDEFIQLFGVPEPDDDNEARIIDATSFWTQPTNHVEPSTGVPSSAWTWSVDLKMNRSMKAKEPGIIMLLACVRPKVISRKADVSAIGRLAGLGQWIPGQHSQNWHVIQADDPVFADALQVAATDLIIDRADLWVHGEAFINDVAGNLPYTIPQDVQADLDNTDLAALRGEFCTDGFIDTMFTGTTAPERRVFYDGLGSMRVHGHVVELTPIGEGQTARDRMASMPRRRR